MVISSADKVYQPGCAVESDRHEGRGARYAYCRWIAAVIAYAAEVGGPTLLSNDTGCMFIAIPRAPVDRAIHDNRLARNPSAGMCRPGARERRGGCHSD